MHVRRRSSQFEQVVINVFRNAIEVDRRATATIARRRSATASLTVADSGRGIDRRDAHELFTPFFTTKREGRGLGLTIVQEILEQPRLPVHAAEPARAAGRSS